MVIIDNNSVRVVVRVRPQSACEKAEHSRVCTSVVLGVPQISIGEKKSFTYDFVFNQTAQQEAIYDQCIRELVEGTFDGYNATVLAYGQTGSGKTYTMGTSCDSVNAYNAGIIPRAAAHIFEKIEELKLQARESGVMETQFEILVQFVELYNEEIVDLLAEDRRSGTSIKIYEDPAKGEIYLKGVTNVALNSANEMLQALQNGALNRTSAPTNMKQQSPRSHAIFTVQIKQQRMVAVNNEDAQNLSINGKSAPLTEIEMLTAKFHFVDLAGSERLKKTGATGDRAKEGISINSGLLALGNVISALGGGSGRVHHVPYRNSKLTRLLRDSLGGNSRTLMIACASPSDGDFVETFNTLNYANRAKNIKNKVVANQHKSSEIFGELRGRIAALEAELLKQNEKDDQIKTLQNALELSTQEHNAKLEQMKVKYRKLIFNLDEQLEKQTRLRQQAEKRAASADQEKATLADDLATNQTAKAESEKKRKNAENCYCDLNTRLAEMEEAKKIVEVQLAKLQAYFGTLVRQKDDDKRSMSSLQRRFDAVQQQLDESQELLQDEIRQKLSLQSQLRAVESGKLSVTEQLDEQSAQCRQYEAQMASLKQQLADARKKINDDTTLQFEEFRKRTQKEIELLQKALSEADERANLQRVTVERDQHVQELRERGTKILSLNNELDPLLEEVERDNRNLQMELDDLNLEEQLVQSPQLQLEKTSVEQKLKVAEERLSELQDAFEKLQKENLDEHNAQYSNQLLSEEGKAKHPHKQHQRMNTLIAQLSKEKNELRVKNEELEEDLRTEKVLLVEEKRARDMLSSEFENLRKESNELREQLNELGEYYEVEEIVGHKSDDKKRNLFYIKWKGFSENFNTWEPETNLKSADALLEEYLRKNGLVRMLTPARH